jgi:hypothetical protein
MKTYFHRKGAKDAKEIIVSKSRPTPKIFRCHSRLDRESRIVLSQGGNQIELMLGSRFRGNDEEKLFSSLRSLRLCGQI